MAYATPAELLAQIQGAQNTDVAVLEAILKAATEAIDNYCNRPDGFVAVETAAARVYANSGKPYLEIDECIAVSQVEIKDSGGYTVVATDDWEPFAGDSRRPNYNRTPYTRLMLADQGQRVRVTARWGYAATVPAVIKQAVITQATRWYKRAESGWADATGNADFGMMLFRRVLDPDVEMMLKDGRFIRPSIG